MKIRTSDLVGLALGWAVGKCEYPHNKQLRYSRDVYGDRVEVFWVVDEKERHIAYFEPQHNWSQGGPILDREDITVGPWDTSPAMAHKGLASSVSSANPRMVGPTKLVAGLRCHVASVFGDEIDVPDELIA